MNTIGEELKEARILASVNLDEVCEDTGIPVVALEQIESGSIGSFKDIFKLKEYLSTYAKYLGLNGDEIIDRFNEYMFEYTSKIPTADVERAIEEKEREEVELPPQGIQTVSPYLKPKEDNNRSKIVVTSIVIIILVAITLIWAIKQVS